MLLAPSVDHLVTGAHTLPYPSADGGDLIKSLVRQSPGSPVLDVPGLGGTRQRLRFLDCEEHLYPLIRDELLEHVGRLELHVVPSATQDPAIAGIAIRDDWS